MKEARKPRPRSFHPSVLAANRQVKEGRSPFTPLFWPQTERRKKAALLSPLCFGRKPTGEGRPRCFLPAVLATSREVKEGRAPFTPGFGRKPRGEGSPRSFHPSVSAANRQVKEGRAPFTPRFGRKPRGEEKPRSFHPSVLAANRQVKEARAPFTPRFWPQTER